LEFLVDRLQLFLTGLQLFGSGAVFLVDGLQFLVGCAEFLVGGIGFLAYGPQARLGEFELLSQPTSSFACCVSDERTLSSTASPSMNITSA
jgi:hypothetical protein